MSKSAERKFKVPFVIREMKSSKMDRRSFLIKTAMAGLAAVLPLYACAKSSKSKIASGHDLSVLSQKQWDILIAVQDIVFPTEEGSPGAREINAAAFVQWVISDPEFDHEESKFLKDGLDWVDEEAVERWGKPFLAMLPENREKLLRHIESAHSWGESWLSVMLLHIFEALFSDPVYGTIPNDPSHEWLGYTAGQPRPKMVYSEILASKRNITN